MHQVNGCLLYFDKIPDGFYLIHGMDPYVWTLCTDLQESGRIPSIETLKSIDPSSKSSLEVILVDRLSDPILKELQNKVHDIFCRSISTTYVVEQLAKLVFDCMGWVSLTLLAMNYLACTSLTVFYCCNKGFSFCMGRQSFSHMEGVH